MQGNVDAGSMNNIARYYRNIMRIDIICPNMSGGFVKKCLVISTDACAFHDSFNMPQGSQISQDLVNPITK